MISARPLLIIVVLFLVCACARQCLDDGDGDLSCCAYQYARSMQRSKRSEVNSRKSDNKEAQVAPQFVVVSLLSNGEYKVVRNSERLSTVHSVAANFRHRHQGRTVLRGASLAVLEAA